MKILFTSADSAGSVKMSEMDLEKNGKSFYKPLTLKLDADLTAETTVRVWAETQKTGNRVTRVMFKTEIPYQGLYPINPAGQATVSAFSPARSGNLMTAHTVYTLPKEVYEDLAQQRAGSAGFTLAVAQVRALFDMHTRCAGGWRGFHNSWEKAFTSSGVVTGTDFNRHTLEGHADTVSATPKKWAPIVRYDADSNVLDMTSITDLYRTNPDPSDQRVDDVPLLRGILGHAPWADTKAIGDRKYQAPIDA